MLDAQMGGGELREEAEDFLKDLVRVNCPLPNHDFSLMLPAESFTSHMDPTLFYRMPKGLALWDAGHALAVCISSCEGMLSELASPEYKDTSMPVIGPETAVLELGSGGVPLASLVCADLGAPTVLATDCLPEVVDHARINIKENFPHLDANQSVSADVLEWGTDLDHIECQKFDVVLGGDILYGPREVCKLLAETIDEVTDIGAALVTSHTRRMQEDENWMIEEVLLQKGFTMVAEIDDNYFERWQKYGRIAHNAQPGGFNDIKMLVFIKTGKTNEQAAASA